MRASSDWAPIAAHKTDKFIAHGSDLEILNKGRQTAVDMP